MEAQAGREISDLKFQISNSRPSFPVPSMSNPSLAHDLALKRTVHTPVEQKTHFAWRDVVAGAAIEVPAVTPTVCAATNHSSRKSPALCT